MFKTYCITFRQQLVEAIKICHEQGSVYVILVSRIILMYWTKSRLMIHKNITIFLGEHYTILWNQRMLKQQQ